MLAASPRLSYWRYWRNSRHPPEIDCAKEIELRFLVNIRFKNDVCCLKICQGHILDLPSLRKI